MFCSPPFLPGDGMQVEGWTACSVLMVEEWGRRTWKVSRDHVRPFWSPGAASGWGLCWFPILTPSPSLLAGGPTCCLSIKHRRAPEVWLVIPWLTLSVVQPVTTELFLPWRWWLPLGSFPDWVSATTISPERMQALLALPSIPLRSLRKMSSNPLSVWPLVVPGPPAGQSSSRKPHEMCNKSPSVLSFPSTHLTQHPSSGPYSTLGVPEIKV